MSAAPLFPLFALCRHRMGSDGAGVTTLAAARGCPLRCKYCLSPQALKEETPARMVAPEELYEMTRVDDLYFQATRGGVTFGGGEPTAGGQFFLDLVQTAHDEGLHVTVDTCGFCPEDRFDKTIGLADLFLFDCKHMDPEQHKKLTGQDNALILRNLEAALSSSTEVRVRMPLMPGLNDSDENLAAMAAFLGRFGRKQVEIMPCHAFGKSKYAALGKPYPDVQQYTPEGLKAAEERFARHGLVPVIV